MRLTTIIFTTLALATIFQSALLADVAYLRNGQTLQVSGFRLDGDFVFLMIDGGGELALPNAEVMEIRRIAPGTGTPRTTPVAVAQAPASPALEAGDRTTPGERAAATIPPRPPAAIDPTTEALVAGEVFDHELLRRLAGRIAEHHGLDSALVQAVVHVESRYDTFAVSPRGAMGLMQLMPQTAARFDVGNVFDPVENLDGGVRYLKELLERYSGQTNLALAAYNAGERAVERYNGIPPYRETMQYVDRVMRAIQQ